MKTKGKEQAQVAGEIDQRVVKALAHPIRVRVLTLLNQRVASPSELAEELGEPLGNVSYHVRTLLDLKCIELVRTAPRRGAVEHYYRAVERPMISDSEWAEIPKSLRRSIAGAVLTETWKSVDEAARGSGFDRPEMYLTRTTLVLDEEGWKTLNKALGELHERALEIQAESAGRLADEGGKESESAELALMLFDGPGAPSRKPAGKRRSRARS